MKAALTSLLALAVIAQAPRPPLQGTVVDEASKPVAGAAVIFQRSAAERLSERAADRAPRPTPPAGFGSLFPGRARASHPRCGSIGRDWHSRPWEGARRCPSRSP